MCAKFTLVSAKKNNYKVYQSIIKIRINAGF